MRSNKIFFVRICLLAVFVLLGFGCGGGGGGGGGGDDIADNTGSTPTYTPSGDQAKLIEDEGIPEYLTISVNSDTGRREESWVYTKLGKMIVFWDGKRVKEVPITYDESDYSNPPYIDPTILDSATTKQNLVDLFGNNYNLIDQSEGSLSFETWFYEDIGLAVSLMDDKIVAVQTIDKP